jgi:hypothetical protein
MLGLVERRALVLGAVDKVSTARFVEREATHNSLANPPIQYVKQDGLLCLRALFGLKIPLDPKES